MFKVCVQQKHAQLVAYLLKKNPSLINIPFGFNSGKQTKSSVFGKAHQDKDFRIALNEHMCPEMNSCDLRTSENVLLTKIFEGKPLTLKKNIVRFHSFFNERLMIIDGETVKR